MSSMLTIRTDTKLKKSVGDIFKRLGLTHSSAVNMFYHMVEECKGIPFDVKLPNETTANALKEAENQNKLNTAENLDDLFSKLDA